MLQDIREELHRAFAETEPRRAAERALIDAAGALPQPEILRRQA